MSPAFLNWSSGKDAAYALLVVQQQKQLSVQKLVTTIDSDTRAVTAHNLPEGLLERQARALGIQLQLIELSEGASMKQYSKTMFREFDSLAKSGFTHSIYGDIFLEDIREYREKDVRRAGLEPVFPLWKKDTYYLMEQFISLGFRAITVSVNAALLDRSFCGREINRDFLADLPADVDPAGERGEFHTFVYDGPIFHHPVDFSKGTVDLHQYPAPDNQWDNRFWQCSPRLPHS